MCQHATRNNNNYWPYFLQPIKSYHFFFASTVFKWHWVLFIPFIAFVFSFQCIASGTKAAVFLSLFLSLFSSIINKLVYCWVFFLFNDDDDDWIKRHFHDFITFSNNINKVGMSVTIAVGIVMNSSPLPPGPWCDLSLLVLPMN